jgi:hypothetical protein
VDEPDLRFHVRWGIEGDMKAIEDVRIRVVAHADAKEGSVRFLSEACGIPHDGPHENIV